MRRCAALTIDRRSVFYGEETLPSKIRKRGTVAAFVGPWKYGFKGAKSIGEVWSFVRKQPLNHLAKRKARTR
jgi:DMSO/TMAO reductase YedYZ molybdopterin-dependent catalytic subunit